MCNAFQTKNADFITHDTFVMGPTLLESLRIWGKNQVESRSNRIEIWRIVTRLALEDFYIFTAKTTTYIICHLH